MKAVIRESIARQLLAVPRLIDRYQRHDPSFVEKTLEWLRELEQDLAKLRHPAAAFAASRRGVLLAATDGYRRPEVGESSARKAVRSTASIVVNEVAAEMTARLRDLDAFLDEMTEKMAQLLAVATVDNPIPLPPTEPRSAWLDTVWRSLDGGNGAGMYSYLQTRLSRVDRHYLLDRLLDNLLSGDDG